MPYKKVGDINMYYEVHGKGEPLLLFKNAGHILIEAGDKPDQTVLDFLKRNR